MNNVVCELRNELTKSVDSTLKHELSVVREEQHNLKDEMEEKLKKAEVEVKRLKGRVASLVDEKNNLIKQIKSLQNDNKSLKQNTTNKTPKVKENRPAIPTNPPANQASNTDNNSPAIRETLNVPVVSISDTTTTKTPVTPTDETTKIPAVETTNVYNDESTTKPSEYDFVMLCDSNRKFLDINKLCSNRNSKIIACNTTKKAKEILESPKFEVKKGIIINTGVNDNEHLSAEEIVKSQVQMVNMAVKEFPGRQIVVCGIIPRGDELDRQIPDINNEIHEQIKDIPSVSHIYNGNLRNGIYFDHKHLNRKFGVPAFAKNIKRELRLVFGPRRNKNPGNQQRDAPTNQNQETYHHRNANPGQLQNQEQKTVKSLHDGKQSTIYDELKQVSTLLTQLIQNNTSMNQQRIQYQMYPQAAFPPQSANTRFI